MGMGFAIVVEGIYYNRVISHLFSVLNGKYVGMFRNRKSGDKPAEMKILT